MNFDKILPQNFFNLFQSKHRNLYIESLIRVYEKYETGSILGMLKEQARDIIIDLLEEEHVGLDEFSDETEDELPDYKELANHFIRRLEKTGWVQIDVNNDYIEILNFTDYAISLILAFIEIKRDSFYSLFSDSFSLDPNEQAFKGYIFTIHSLLNSKTYDYGLLLKTVYRNTVSFVREIRKVDYKLKEFIKLIDQKENIKDLIELLSQYKDDVLDKAYFKLKTFDNINKYKFDIIKKLEHLQETPDIMSMIANDYMYESGNDGMVALATANKQINDCIDIYNSLESVMTEIDKKNRDYVSQTLSKIKYLLNDSTDVLGELNSIVRFYTTRVRSGKEDSGFNAIRNLFDINDIRTLSTKSLSFPRGSYEKKNNNVLIKETIDINKMRETFYQMFNDTFKEDQIKETIDGLFKNNNIISVKDLIKDSGSREDLLRVIYTVIYVSQDNKYALSCDNTYYETQTFIISNFTIRIKEEC